jgi:hypothetical protein
MQSDADADRKDKRCVGKLDSLSRRLPLPVIIHYVNSQEFFSIFNQIILQVSGEMLTICADLHFYAGHDACGILLRVRNRGDRPIRQGKWAAVSTAIQGNPKRTAALAPQIEEPGDPFPPASPERSPDARKPLRKADSLQDSWDNRRPQHRK